MRLVGLMVEIKLFERFWSKKMLALQFADMMILCLSQSEEFGNRLWYIRPCVFSVILFKCENHFLKKKKMF